MSLKHVLIRISCSQALILHTNKYAAIIVYSVINPYNISIASQSNF